MPPFRNPIFSLGRLAAMFIWAVVPAARAETVVTGAWVLCTAGEAPPEQQIKHCDDALADEEIVATERAFAHFSRGTAYQALGKLTEAIADYDASLKLRADVPPVLNNRGVALKNAGRLEEAVADFDKVIAIDPDKASNAYANRAEILAENNKFAEAIADMSRAIALAPGTANYFASRGRFHGSEKNWTKARDDFAKAAELEPNEAINRNNLGYALEQLGDASAALQAYDKALALDPHYGFARKNRDSLVARKPK